MDSSSSRGAGGKPSWGKSTSVSTGADTEVPVRVRRSSVSTAAGETQEHAAAHRRQSAASQSDATVMSQEPSRRQSAVDPSSSDLAELHRRRRSSTFSNYSYKEAKEDLEKEILDPTPAGAGSPPRQTSWKSRLPIMIGVLPPAAGIIIKGGAAFFSDLMLMGLVAIFLHWSVTTPWKWYEAAQQVRVTEEAKPGISSDKSSEATTDQQHNEVQRKAIVRLKRREILALLSCYVAPLMGALLLYSVRRALSPEAETLMDGFNITVFILAAEVSPVSHAIKLVMAQTLHLQRVVQSSPYGVVPLTPERFDGMLRRLDQVEAAYQTLLEKQQAIQAAPHPPPPAPTPPSTREHGEGGCPFVDDPPKRDMLVARLRADAAAALQPQIDALTRAVRRYERRASELEADVDARLGALERRTDDALALTAAAVSGFGGDARGNQSRRGLIRTVVGGGWALVTFPLTATVGSLSWLLSDHSQGPAAAEGSIRGGGEGRGEGRSDREDERARRQHRHSRRREKEKEREREWERERRVHHTPVLALPAPPPPSTPPPQLRKRDSPVQHQHKGVSSESASTSRRRGDSEVQPLLPGPSRGRESPVPPLQASSRGRESPAQPLTGSHRRRESGAQTLPTSSKGRR